MYFPFLIYLVNFVLFFCERLIFFFGLVCFFFRFRTMRRRRLLTLTVTFNFGIFWGLLWTMAKNEIGLKRRIKYLKDFDS